MVRRWWVWKNWTRDCGGYEPPETTGTCIAVAAPTKKAAIVRAVKKWRKRKVWHHEYDECPFTGVKAEPREGSYAELRRDEPEFWNSEYGR